ncbi:MULTISPECIES: hypothetical protein [Actibacterium]|uniref:DUF11 domain-containing protein n=1 Tax=Actibacterium naphthalenivorans TaxID=1614693 RepID=A0A840C657_9RHOB|nr:MULTISPECIES: hypothetical protein [Actibacterium]ALG89947.1 hypothetical protein TQ29_06725 [Actibacterium sp. EMB200-NS6]MBB4020313.1 hypothetical protein [Actibacterium naphthalenivorans]
MFVQIPRTSRAVLAGVALSLVGLPAFAEALSSTFSFLVVETGDDGQEQLVERGTVRPGEVIHYQLHHENMTEAAMGGIVIAAPVPEGVSLQIGGETTSVAAVFEVQAELDPEQDGLEWSTLPAMRKVADADGSLREEPLPQEAVAAVRWVFSELLEPGASALNTYRVRVD